MIETRNLVQRSPVYYGWVVWVIATIGLIATSPGQSYSVSFFFDRFIEDFNMDRTTISGLYGLGTFIASLALTWVGRRIDKNGNRAVSTVILVLFAGALVMMAFVNGAVALLLGFIAIRGLGQGSLSLTSTTLIAQWFKRRRGLMISLSMVLFAIFQSLYAPWLQNLLTIYDWRQVWLILAALVAGVALPLTWGLTRNRPEDYGLLPDGAAKPAPDAPIVPEIIEDNWTLREAMGTVIFWVFLLGRLLLPAWGTGLIIHQVSIFASLGHPEATAALVFSIFSLISAGVSLLSGVIIDRFRPNVTLILQLVTLALALFVAQRMTANWTLVLYAIFFGIAMGSGAAFDGAIWPNLFGRLHQGAIRGFATTTLIAGTAVGPILFGVSFDYLGGYNPIFWLGIVLAVPTLIISLFVDRPRRREPAA